MPNKKQSDQGKQPNPQPSGSTRLEYVIENNNSTRTHGTMDGVNTVRNDLAPPPNPNRNSSGPKK